jgi:hypothetical protein
VAQRDMTADERAVQHVREDVAAIYPDILFREAQNCRSPGSTPLEGGYLANL